MRKLMLALLAVITFGMMGCAVNQTIPHSYAPDVITPFNQDELYTVSVSVTDDRPYVLSGDKESCFIGIYKAGFGNAWDVRTDGKIPLANALKRDLVNDLQNAGFSITQDNAERKIIVSIREYNFNCYMNCRVWHNLQVTIQDASGKKLQERIVNTDQNVAGSVWTGPKAAMERDVPKIYAQMIRNIVRNDPEVMAVLKH